MMAAERPVRYTCTIRLGRDRKFGDWIKPLHEYDDLGLFQRFGVFFGRREVLEAVDEFNDLQYIASTKGSSSALVGGRSCTCVCTSLEPFLSLFCLFLHFMVYSGNCNWSILSSLFFLIFFSFVFPPVSFVVFAVNYDAYFFYFFLFYIIIIIINANNDRFAVLCNRYFSACDWRFIWCQFVTDVKENPG